MHMTVAAWHLGRNASDTGRTWPDIPGKAPRLVFQSANLPLAGLIDRQLEAISHDAKGHVERQTDSARQVAVSNFIAVDFNVARPQIGSEIPVQRSEDRPSEAPEQFRFAPKDPPCTRNQQAVDCRSPCGSRVPPEVHQ